MTSTSQVILIDDEEHLRTACRQALELADIPVQSFKGPDGALDDIGRDWPGIVVTDIKMPGTSGLEVMKHVLSIDPDIPVILITGHGDVQMAVEAMRAGAYDFVEKPFPSERMVDAVRRALEKRRLSLEVRSLRATLEDTSLLKRSLLGNAPQTRRLRDEIKNLAETDVDVLIEGETGSGKELVARSLHELSPRSGNHFVAINCGALPETVIESELFGHEPGAFTGAIKKRIGKIEHANGGTLFLDEIESMPLDVQVKLLRVLQDRVVTPLGGNEERQVDIRVIAATKEDLRELADLGTFRADLNYRLDVLKIRIPPLRERREDIPLLFQHFVNLASERVKRPPRMVSREKLMSLSAAEWPGNVRELQNAALRYALDADHEETKADGSPNQSLSEQLDAVEKNIIASELASQGGSLKATYESLGISRKTLYDKMQKHGLKSD